MAIQVLSSTEAEYFALSEVAKEVIFVKQVVDSMGFEISFVRDFIKDGILKVIFVKSENNDEDILTKNTTEELFHKHAKKDVEKVNKDNNT
jgi:hypothetical protein